MVAEEEEPKDNDTENDSQEEKPQDHVETPNDDINPDPAEDGANDPAQPDVSGEIAELRNEISAIRAMLDAMGVGSGKVAEPEPEDDPAEHKSFDDLFGDDGDSNDDDK